MAERKTIEVFSAGCSVCNETIALVKQLAGTSHELIILDMHDSRVASKARDYGIRSVPAVVIDGRLAACCGGRGPEEDAIRSGLGG